ncbi:MAG: UDP-3-O-(3-hydroxymyristoyl)glucosamine N-acyltransferase [Planctomycetota bacterium]
MVVTLGELANLVSGRLSGEATLVITGAATIRDARAGEITLADRPKYAERLPTCSAAAAVVCEGFPPSSLPTIMVRDVHRAFAQIVSHFRPPRQDQQAGVSAAAAVSPTARLGPDVVIYPGASIGDDVELGARCIVHPGVRLMAGCRIGADSVLFPNAVLYENTIVGDRCLIHAGAVLGAYGFGYETAHGQHRLSAQLGYVILGCDVEIGACTTIDRGTYGPTTVGDGTKIDNQVQIAHNCRIGRHNLICSQVGIAGSCTTGDYVVLAGQVGVRDHIAIGDGVMVGAQSGVASDIAAAGKFLGSPAIAERDEIKMMMARGRLPEMRKQLKTVQRMLELLMGETADPSLDESLEQSPSDVT